MVREHRDSQPEGVGDLHRLNGRWARPDVASVPNYLILGAWLAMPWTSPPLYVISTGCRICSGGVLLPPEAIFVPSWASRPVLSGKRARSGMPRDPLGAMAPRRRFARPNAFEKLGLVFLGAVSPGDDLPGVTAAPPTKGVGMPRLERKVALDGAKTHTGGAPCCDSFIFLPARVLERSNPSPRVRHNPPTLLVPHSPRRRTSERISRSLDPCPRPTRPNLRGGSC